EIAALRVRDLDLRAGIVSVERSIAVVPGCRIEGRPKTKAGRRMVTLPTAEGRVGPGPLRPGR
ncbi:MAG: site-specific integrase, partial [Acidimicrobiales bacterium]